MLLFSQDGTTRIITRRITVYFVMLYYIFMPATLPPRTQAASAADPASAAAMVQVSSLGIMVSSTLVQRRILLYTIVFNYFVVL